MAVAAESGGSFEVITRRNALLAGLGLASSLQAATPHPLYFEPNRGQFGSGPVFCSDQKRWRASFEARGLRVEMKRLVGDGGAVTDPARLRNLRLSLVEAACPAPVGEDKRIGRSDYYFHGDPKTFVENVPHFYRLRYREAWPGVDMVVASGVAAAIGDVRRFPDPTKLVSYLGLNPNVRQSGEGPAYHGRITKQGRSQARGMLVEAAWAVARPPGPLRAFFQRIASRRGKHVAAVATARKLAMIIWHMLTKSTYYIRSRLCRRLVSSRSHSICGVGACQQRPSRIRVK